MVAGMQHVRRLAQNLLGLVAGDFDEGAIDAQDDVIGIGDHHAFLGLEGSGGDAEFFVAEVKIAQRPAQVLRHVVEGGDGLPHLRPAARWDARRQIAAAETAGAGDQGIERPQAIAQNQDDAEELQPDRQGQQVEMAEESHPQTLDARTRRHGHDQRAVVAPINADQPGAKRIDDARSGNEPGRRPRRARLAQSLDQGPIGGAPGQPADVGVAGAAVEDPADGGRVAGDGRLGQQRRLRGQFVLELSLELGAHAQRIPYRRRHQQDAGRRAENDGGAQHQARRERQTRPKANQQVFTQILSPSDERWD